MCAIVAIADVRDKNCIGKNRKAALGPDCKVPLIIPIVRRPGSRRSWLAGMGGIQHFYPPLDQHFIFQEVEKEACVAQYRPKLHIKIEMLPRSPPRGPSTSAET